MKVKLDHDLKYMFVWLLREEDTQEINERIELEAKEMKYKLITYVSGTGSLETEIEQLIMNNI
ncbi:hypothetical protein [Cohnella sp. WQ 127256]|uniref:hypothetical protein n=1 Tax=Cohnella sp. WQ 127256 TaxID=2938790 RepID=UPI0021182813|nr:hypothetical protein [Cohnella sp. WQ 127256]